MCMNNAPHVRPLLIYPHMHLDLRGRLESAVRLNHISLGIHLTDILGSHKALGHPGGRTKILVVIQLHGNIAIVSRHHIPVVDPFTDITYLFFDLVLVLHFDSS